MGEMFNRNQVNTDMSSSPPSSLQHIPNWPLLLSSTEMTALIKMTCDFHVTKFSGQLSADLDRNLIWPLLLPQYQLPQ